MNNINIRQTERFIELTPMKGYKITSWNEDDDIMNFTYSECIVMPLEYDYSMFKTISDEEVERLEKLIKEKLEENV